MLVAFTGGFYAATAHAGLQPRGAGVGAKNRIGLAYVRRRRHPPRRGRVARGLCRARRRGRGAAWRLAGWFVGAGEVWLIPWSLGQPISFADAIILELLSHGARAAAFIVPGGLGVQDGTLMVLTTQLGLGPEMGLVIALVKRCREVALGVPAARVAWAGEMRRLQRRRLPA